MSNPTVAVLLAEYYLAIHSSRSNNNNNNSGRAIQII